MKRNLFYSFLAATSLLTLGACSNDELASETPDGGTSAVTFAVKAPTGMQSRAFADGTTATALSYAVYDETGKHLSTLDGTATMSSLKAEVSLNLVTGNTYKIVFFAQKAGTYTLDFDKATMTMPTTVNANDEGLDAFFKTEEIKVTGNSTQTVELRRPFAQLNIGTDDIKAAQSSGLAVAQTEVKVTGVPNVLNFLDGTVSGSQEVTYTAAAIPTGETFPVSGYEYLSMNYILMGTDKATTDVTLTIDGTKECTYASVPVQRNYRTNIYGSLLTSTAKFNVVIKPEFNFDKPDYGMSETANVTTVDELTAAIAKGETNLVLATGEYQIPSGFDASKGITLKSATGNPADVVIKFQSSGQEWAHKANVTFKDVTVDRTGSSDYTGHIKHADAENYINCIINGLVQIYAPSASFTNCIFNNEKSSGFAGYSVFIYGDKATVLIDKCEFKDVSKAIVVYSEGANWTTDLTVNNTTFTASNTSTDKTAISIHTELKNMSGTIRINNCTATGFANYNSGLWREFINSGDDKGTATNYFNIYVDGTQVQQAK